jgi:hypothetical protein
LIYRRPHSDRAVRANYLGLATGGRRAALRRLTIAPYHWADLNGDNRVGDEVDLIWTAGGYSWDAASVHYRVVK